MIPAVFRTMTAAEAAASSRAAIKRIAPRSTRLQAQGIETDELVEFEMLRRAKPTTRNEEVARARRLSEIDRSGAVRARTAPAILERQKQARFAERAKNNSQLSYMTHDELKRAEKIRRRAMDGQQRRVNAEFPEGTHATRRYQEFKDDMPPGETRGQLLHRISKMNDISRYEGMTVQGAKDQQQRGVDYFGEAYKGWTEEERNSVWDAVHRKMELESLSSDRALDEIKEIMEQGIEVAWVMAYKKDGSPVLDADGVHQRARDGRGRITAVFGANATDAQNKAASVAGATSAKSRILEDSDFEDPLDIDTLPKI